MRIVFTPDILKQEEKTNKWSIDNFDNTFVEVVLDLFYKLNDALKRLH